MISAIIVTLHSRGGHLVYIGLPLRLTDLRSRNIFFVIAPQISPYLRAGVRILQLLGVEFAELFPSCEAADQVSEEVERDAKLQWREDL